MIYNNFNKFRVSFIFATKDRESNLDNVFSHLEKFIKDNDELIIINGGNNCFLEKIKVLNIKNLKYIHEKDFSDSHAFNKGFLIAQGLIIRSICDDDYYDINNHEIVFNLLQNDNYLDFIFCGGIKKNTINGSISYINVPKGIGYGSSIKHIARYTASGTGHIFKRSVLAKVGLWENPVPDFSFLAKCINSPYVNVKFLSLNCFIHYYNEDSISNIRIKEKNKFILKNIYNYCGAFEVSVFFLRRLKILSYIKKIINIFFINKNSKENQIFTGEYS